MNAKEETIRHMSSRLMRIVDKHVRVENLPIEISQGILLRPGEVRFIQVIGEHEGTNIMTLGKVMKITKSAVSQMVSKLGKKGLVAKRSAIDNNKEILVFLTPAGQEALTVFKQFHEHHIQNLIQALVEFSDTQIATTDMILSAVEDIAQERMDEMFGKKS